MKKPNIPNDWAELHAKYGDRLYKQFKNREWQVIHKRHGDELGLTYEEVVAFGKWSRDQPREEVKPSEDVPPPSEQEFVSDDRYWYDRENDTYVTFLPDVGPINVPGTKHRAMLDLYSNMIGEGTINQVCREFGMPRAWFTKYKQIHGWTKDHEPFTAEEMVEGDTEQLVQEALQKKRATFYRKFEQEKWKEVQKEAKKWREFETQVLAKVTEVIGNRSAPPVKRLNLKTAKSPYAAVVGLSDFHWGKYSDRENGE